MSLLHVGKDETENLDWSTYGFLYGTFPAAPTVFVFATQYVLDIDLVCGKRNLFIILLCLYPV